MKKNTFLFFMIGLLTFYTSFAQTNDGRKVFGREVKSINPANGSIRCASTEYEEQLQENNPERLNKKAFEAWIAPKIAKIKADRLAGRSTNAVVTIPVVVHVIHSGQTVGNTGRNITDDRVQSQITVLNQDFRKMIGTPGYNTNAIGADIEIDFCLAQTGPDGEVVNGIDRVNLGATTWNESNVETILKPQTQWDPNRYFNIWVCQFGGDLNGVYGYAQFPSGSGLNGINVDGGLATTDGVIIDWRAFGTSTLASGTYFSGIDKGRTATHEIGHCLGLRHIWGDNSYCTIDAIDSYNDFCLDTPAANTEHYDCNAVYNTCAAAPGNDMTENYMDYSNDLCFNIFTVDQKARMQAVIQNSVRRASLKSSTACNIGQTYQYNGRLKTSSLNIQTCSQSFAPTFTLTNKGSVTMASAVITYSVDNGATSTFNWSGSLATNATATITLPTVTSVGGNHVFKSNISAINGSNPDQFSLNNTIEEPFVISDKFNTAQVVIEIQRDAYGSETSWSFVNVTTGTTVASGSGYSDTGSLPALFTRTVAVVNNNCYRFTINDAQGDGICCDYGNGYYNLKTSTGNLIATGGAFTNQDIKSFSIDTSLSNQDFGLLGGINLYPNPAKDVVNIDVDKAQLPESYVIYNSLGQIMVQKKINSESDLNINISIFSNGIYFIKVQKENQTKTLRFVKD